LEPFFKIVHLTNTGAAFGLLQGQGGLFVMIALVVIAAVLVYSRYLPVDNWGVRLALALQLGGAIGNVIDRLQWGRVTDFLLLSLPLRGRVFEWPAFNVADSCIVVGVILMAVLLIRADNQRTESAPVETPQEAVGAQPTEEG
jgi:signal peptidase II